MTEINSNFINDIVERVTKEVVSRVKNNTNNGTVPHSDRPINPDGSLPVCNATTEECEACGYCVVRRPADVQTMLDLGVSRFGTKQDIEFGDKKIAQMIDHTMLKAETTYDTVEKICNEAIQYGFASVCVNPINVAQVSARLNGTAVKTCAVVGFPLGATPPSVKSFETRECIKNGANEIDMVINVGALKSGNYNLVKEDIEGVVRAAQGNTVKVILETALLSDEEKVAGCIISKAAGAHFVKTSTGFGPGGATAEDIVLMRKLVGPDMGVKASGGIRTKADAEKMISAGATRIGASASVAIIRGQESKSDY